MQKKGRKMKKKKVFKFKARSKVFKEKGSYLLYKVKESSYCKLVRKQDNMNFFCVRQDCTMHLHPANRCMEGVYFYNIQQYGTPINEVEGVLRLSPSDMKTLKLTEYVSTKSSDFNNNFGKPYY